MAPARVDEGSAPSGGGGGKRGQQRRNRALAALGPARLMLTLMLSSHSKHVYRRDTFKGPPAWREARAGGPTAVTVTGGPRSAL